jgi:hypothetical protein
MKSTLSRLLRTLATWIDGGESDTCECPACEFLRAHGRDVECGLDLALEESCLDGEERGEATETNVAFAELLRKVGA